ncbi:hypothetical protein SAMN05216522_1261 [Rosenbergiella nectarea]|uniref:Uncharacterized protein n=1 Tax=Rosenbergiella nectarea TaxID=988801 RepID=A0A1H9N6K3_9GAMM|nr:hypothetical protein SAMN05216522_1261 [Rosenbergiella nectarea]
MCLVHRQHDLVVRIASRHPANASQTNKKFICPFTVFDGVIGQCFMGLGIKSP